MAGARHQRQHPVGQRPDQTLAEGGEAQVGGAGQHQYRHRQPGQGIPQRLLGAGAGQAQAGGQAGGGVAPPLAHLGARAARRTVGWPTSARGSRPGRRSVRARRPSPRPAPAAAPGPPGPRCRRWRRSAPAGAPGRVARGRHGGRSGRPASSRGDRRGPRRPPRPAGRRRPAGRPARPTTRRGRAGPPGSVGGGRQCLAEGPPEPPGLGEAVGQHQRRAVAGGLDVQRRPRRGRGRGHSR